MMYHVLYVSIILFNMSMMYLVLYLRPLLRPFLIQSVFDQPRSGFFTLSKKGFVDSSFFD